METCVNSVQLYFLRAFVERCFCDKFYGQYNAIGVNILGRSSYWHWLAAVSTKSANAFTIFGNDTWCISISITHGCITMANKIYGIWKMWVTTPCIYITIDYCLLLCVVRRRPKPLLRHMNCPNYQQIFTVNNGPTEESHRIIELEERRYWCQRYLLPCLWKWAVSWVVLDLKCMASEGFDIDIYHFGDRHPPKCERYLVMGMQNVCVFLQKKLLLNRIQPKYFSIEWNYGE